MPEVWGFEVFGVWLHGVGFRRLTRSGGILLPDCEAFEFCGGCLPKRKPVNLATRLPFGNFGPLGSRHLYEMSFTWFLGAEGARAGPSAVHSAAMGAGAPWHEAAQQKVGFL